MDKVVTLEHPSPSQPSPIDRPSPSQPSLVDRIRATSA
jgi:hypothetical protein